MKIEYLTKCPQCGGSIDEEFSKFCPFCGTSLAQSEPMTQEERLKMYEYEDQAVPQKSIVINEKNKSTEKWIGITFLAVGAFMVLLGIIFTISSFALSAVASSYGYGKGYDLFTGIVIGGVMLVIFGGTGLIFVIPGIILLVRNGKHQNDYKMIPDNPDEVFEGTVRRFDAQRSDDSKQSNFYVYVKVEKPKPLILECQYFDISIKTTLRPEQKVKIYRKGNKYILIR